MTSTSALHVGCRITYHGSITDLEGHTFIALPCYWNCTRCSSNPNRRFSLHDPATGTRINCARQQSITPTRNNQWPDDAAPIEIAGYTYMASHTTPGGSPKARIVHFYTADGNGGSTWCFFHEMTDTIRRLDKRAKAHI